MAIVVDVVAIPYILYITWDEYTGKPLGLRSPKAKIRLVLLDLFFIIFESANLALAFAALTDNNGSCKNLILLFVGEFGDCVGFWWWRCLLGAWHFPSAYSGKEPILTEKHKPDANIMPGSWSGWAVGKRVTNLFA
jgi:hypothetical protein